MNVEYLFLPVNMVVGEALDKLEIELVTMFPSLAG